MPNSRDEENKKKALEDEKIKQLHAAKDHEERMKRIREKTDASSKKKQNAANKDVQKKYQKAQEYLQKLEKLKEQGQGSKNMQVGTYFSWIMDGVPEFEALVKYVSNYLQSKRKQYLGNPISCWVHGTSAYAYYSIAERFGEGRQISDIKFIPELNEEGRVNLQMLRESYGNLFEDEKGEYSEEKASVVYQILNEYMEEWISSLDNLLVKNNAGDFEEKPGYFFVENGNPKVKKLYSKEYGEKDADNNLILKSGNEDNFVKKDEFNFILKGCGYPEKSFSTFLENKCSYLRLDEEAVFRPGM